MAVAMTHDGARFARSGWKVDRIGRRANLGTELSIRDAATGRSIRTIRLPPMHIATQLAFSPDGTACWRLRSAPHSCKTEG